MLNESGSQKRREAPVPRRANLRARFSNVAPVGTAIDVNIKRTRRTRGKIIQYVRVYFHFRTGQFLLVLLVDLAF